MRSSLFLFIFLLAAFLRFYQLGQIPNSLSGDEVAFGYNAYSILQTGRDEYGIKYPLLFQSFNDHKNPVFVYLLVPFVAIFGLNEWAIRLPSAIFGALIIPIFYLLTKRLTGDKKLSLLTAFLAAISPWLIQYSRIALETMTALFFCLLGVWLFLEADKKKFLYLISAISCALAFWSYYASKIWMVIFALFLVIRQVTLVKKIDKWFILFSLVFGLCCLPYLKLYLSGQILARQYGISVFADKEAQIQEAKILDEELRQGTGLVKIFHNRRLVFFNQFINGYLRILSPIWLFSQDGGAQIPKTRLNYLWQTPLLIFGFVSLIRQRKRVWFMIFWVLVGFLPGSLVFLPAFDRRILIVSYPLLFLSALGLIDLIARLKNKLIKKVFVIAWSMGILISFGIYLHYYFWHGPPAVVETWGNGMRELVKVTQKEKNNYKEIIVSIKLDQPLLNFLFYEQYPPQKYLAVGGTVGGDFREERNHFANYQFRKIGSQKLTTENLYVWKASETHPCLTVQKTIFQSDGQSLAYSGVFDTTIEGCAKK